MPNKELSRTAPLSEWQSCMYIAGKSPRSLSALANIQRLCEEHLSGRYTLEVVDLLLHPRRAVEDQILAVPTLIRRVPEPIRKLIGNLADDRSVVTALSLARMT